MSIGGSETSNGIQYEMNDKSQENRNYEHTDYISSNTNGDSDFEKYFGNLQNKANFVFLAKKCWHS